MKKFINDAVNVVPEALRGLARAHREILSLHEKPAFVARAPLAKGTGRLFPPLDDDDEQP